MKEKILLVDDDSNVLNGYRRHLRRDYDITLADGAPRALALFATEGPFAVVVSDMQMPTMNGVVLLSEIAKRDQDTVRIMLTGNADQDTTVAAVNEGKIFRFLNKPCSSDDLAKTIEEGLKQYRLIHAERDLLSKTLSGSVALMTELLSMVNSTAFGRVTRIKSIVHQLCKELKTEEAWQVEIAAMLAQIGCVTVPESVLNRYCAGEDLTSDEQKMLGEQARIGHDLVSRIPRLEGVAEIILRQDLTQSQWKKEDEKTQAKYRHASSMLKIVHDYDLLAAQSSSFNALRQLQESPGAKYDAEILEALAKVVDARTVVREIKMAELSEGMLIAEPIYSKGGELLVKGQNEVTASLLARLKQFSVHRGIEEPIRIQSVLAPTEKTDMDSDQLENVSYSI